MMASAGGGAEIGVFFGQGNPSSSRIQYITISTTGNAAEWGNLLAPNRGQGAFGNAERGVAFGGATNFGDNTIQYITFSSSGNAIDFGDLLDANGTQQNQTMAGTSSDTRGMIMGGQNNNRIQYVTIATTGNSIDFGDFATTARRGGGAGSNGTRAVFGGDALMCEYVTIASTGNATNFGNLTVDRELMQAGCSTTRIVWMGGNSSPYNMIDYVTTASTGNALDFGDLYVNGAFESGACSSKVRAVCAHGFDGATGFVNIMSSVEIATTGNSVDFGDLVSTGAFFSGASNCHGGLS